LPEGSPLGALDGFQMAQTIIAPGMGDAQSCGLRTVFAAVILAESRLEERRAVLARARSLGVTVADW